MRGPMVYGSGVEHVPLKIIGSDGLPRTDLDHTSVIAIAYRRQDQSTWTPISLVAGTVGENPAVGGSFCHDVGGIYQLGLPAVAKLGGNHALVRWEGDDLESGELLLPIHRTNHQDPEAFGLLALAGLGSMCVEQPENPGVFQFTTAALANIPVPDMTVDVGEVTVGHFGGAALAQLTAAKGIFVTVPALVGRRLSQPLIRGDSYLAQHNRAIEFARADFPEIPEGSGVTLTARNVVAGTAVTFTLEGSVAVTSGTKVLRFEPTSPQTRLWEPGEYRFDVEVAFPDGNVATFVGPEAFLTVLADVTL